MQQHLKMRYAIGMCLVFFFYFYSPPVHAADIRYGRVASLGTSSLTVKFSGFKANSEQWYNCPLSTLLCTEVASTTLTATPASSGQTPLQKALAELIIPLPDGAESLTLSPNGRYIAYYIPATLSRHERTFGIIDTTTNKNYSKKEAVEYWDLLTEGVKIFAFSPDSTQLLYLNDKDDPQTLYTVSLSSLPKNGTAFASSRLITKNYSISDFVWTDNSRILFTANRESPLDWSLYAYNTETGNILKKALSTSYATNMKTIGDYILFYQIIGNVTYPTLYDTSTGQVQKLAFPGIVPTNIPSGQVVKAGTLSGVYEKSLVSDPVLSKTLLVWLHGGPFRQAANGYHSYASYAEYDWVLDEARAAGVSVLKLDYPGSFGYGRKFAEKITGNVGVVDVKETVTAIQQFAQRNGYKNIYLIGNSYGGYLSLKTIVDNPSKFTGAFSINGVTDWNLLTQRLETSIFNIQFNGVQTDENKKLYDNASIIDHLNNLGQQHIVLTHGDSDMTIPVEQSQILYEELTTRHKNAESVIYQNEDHVYTKQTTLESLCRSVLQFAGAPATSRCSL